MNWRRFALLFAAGLAFTTWRYAQWAWETLSWSAVCFAWSVIAAPVCAVGAVFCVWLATFDDDKAPLKESR